MRPNFFIVGAPKSGTTALCEYLRSHPNVFMCSPKEPHYFATDFPKKRLVTNQNDYLKLFALANENHLRVGEASVWYLYSRDAIRNIKQFAPEAKIIVMLRNPVDFVYSMHSQALYTRNENENDFRHAWALTSQRRNGNHIPNDCKEIKLLFYDEIGLLGEQIERLCRIFPLQQIKTIFFDDLVNDTKRIYYDVLAFLELPDDFRNDFPIVNSNKRHRLQFLSKLTRRPPICLLRAVESFKRISGLEELGLLRTIECLNRNNEKRPQLDKEIRELIIETYRNDVIKLSRMTGRDLTRWIEGLESPRESMGLPTNDGHAVEAGKLRNRGDSTKTQA